MQLIWFPTVPQVQIEPAVFKRRSAQLLMIYGEETSVLPMDEKSKYVQGVPLFCSVEWWSDLLLLLSVMS